MAPSPTAEATRLIEPCRRHARREYAGDARFERQRFTVILPVPPGLLEKVATCDEVTRRVARDLIAEPRLCGSPPIMMNSAAADTSSTVSFARSARVMDSSARSPAPSTTSVR